LAKVPLSKALVGVFMLFIITYQICSYLAGQKKLSVERANEEFFM
jgi:hypothetical protein